jgi:hypothetical protein
MKFKYLVVDEYHGISGLNNLEMAKAIAVWQPVIDVSAGKLIEAEGLVNLEIKSWDALFPGATVEDPYNTGEKKVEQLPTSGTIDAGDESFPRD